MEENVAMKANYIIPQSQVVSTTQKHQYNQSIFPPQKYIGLRTMK